MDEFDVAVNVRSLFCFHGADETGYSEPYLWVIGLKFDGSTLKQNLNRLSWTPDLFFSTGSHGTIARMKSRVTRQIPDHVGYWRTSLKPIALTDGTGNTTSVPGAVGFAAVLLEENNVPASAAEAGHAALNAFAATTVEQFVTGLNLVELNTAVDGRVADGEKREEALENEFKNRFAGLAKTIEDGASDVVSKAIRNAMDIAESVWAVIDKDELMGTAFHLVTARELLKDQNFYIEYTDQLYEKNASHIESSRYLYNLHSSISAFVQWRAIPSKLPSAFDIEIQGIEKGFSRAKRKFYIAQVGGVVDGKPWWLKRFEASEMIAAGQHRFYIREPNGTQTTVVNVTPPGWHWPYLTTPDDGRPDNNLLRLPLLRDVEGFKTSVLERVS